MTEWIYLQRKTHCYLTPYIEIIGKVYSDTAKKVWFNKSFENYFVTYTNGVMTWYAKKYVVDNLYLFVSKKVIKNPEYLNENYSKFIPEIRALIKLSQKINSINLSKLSNNQLWNLYKQYLLLYESATVYGEPLPLVTKDIVAEHIRKNLKVIGRSIINELMSILTTPIQGSFIAKEEEDLLKIAKKIQKNDKLLFMLRNNKIKDAIVYGEILKHQKEYCWIPYDYGVQIWDIGHFINVLKNLVSNKNCASELKNIIKRKKNLKKKQEKLIKKYNISKDIVKLLDYVKLSTFMMDYKKELFTKSHYLIIPMINELAKRFSTSSIFVRFMNNKEIYNGLAQNRLIDGETLMQRFKLSVCLWDRKGNTKFIIGDKAINFIKKNIKDNPENEKGKKIHGVCASVGRYRGKAKIIMSAMHIFKIKKGDVLIAPMTSPDYVIGMKKAGAIVTDEGGLTCHAAIVSRELRVPCVVGAKKATKIFKDGDLVEVNANHASIKLIE